MRILLIVGMLSTFLFAQEHLQMKNCEKIQLSKFTTLVSCHQVDYLIEYKLEDDEEKDNIKQITAITVKDQKIIMNVSK